MFICLSNNPSFALHLLFPIYLQIILKLEFEMHETSLCLYLPLPYLKLFLSFLFHILCSDFHFCFVLLFCLALIENLPVLLAEDEKAATEENLLDERYFSFS